MPDLLHDLIDVILKVGKAGSISLVLLQQTG